MKFRNEKQRDAYVAVSSLLYRLGMNDWVANSAIELTTREKINYWFKGKWSIHWDKKGTLWYEDGYKFFNTYHDYYDGHHQSIRIGFLILNSSY